MTTSLYLAPTLHISVRRLSFHFDFQTIRGSSVKQKPRFQARRKAEKASRRMGAAVLSLGLITFGGAAYFNVHAQSTPRPVSNPQPAPQAATANAAEQRALLDQDLCHLP